MPHTRSAKKNLRKSIKRRALNRATLRDITLQVKSVNTAGETNLEDLKKQYNLAAKKLDKAGAKRIIHPNKAARLKSQLSKVLNKKTAAK